ncbi:hypothetical protein GPX89_34415 [Nocardia sp. ET3-3]|uniref:AbiTii domain-containing protein n=1 Tax=Nocardia terrae TaxID=2675851 RepID=A0A7K1V706_9NOCA|nr:hypothetical protein [Nocardia terrae]MVU82317.1 hypothetical protein [Nocardia terrae]
MTNVEQILLLTRKALDEFEDPNRGTAAVVRQAHRIAVLRHDFRVQAWLLLQLSDVGSGNSRDELLEVKSKLHALIGPEEGQQEYIRQCENYFATRKMASGDTNGSSIDQLEASLAQIERVYAGYEVLPTNLNGADTYFFSRESDAARAKLIPQLDELRRIISRVRQGVHVYLVKTESELQSGAAESSYFDQIQIHINGLLAKYAPDAATKFVAAQDRIADGSPEGISHALTSCRRMIKSLADALYPPTGTKVTGLDGVDREMSDDAYRNRLVQYVSEQVGKHKNGPVLRSALAEFGSRLNALDALASKGVHAETTLEEARTCVAQTYLLAGDLLSIAEGTSYLTRDEPASS